MLLHLDRANELGRQTPLPVMKPGFSLSDTVNKRLSSFCGGRASKNMVFVPSALSDA